VCGACAVARSHVLARVRRLRSRSGRADATWKSTSSSTPRLPPLPLPPPFRPRPRAERKLRSMTALGIPPHEAWRPDAPPTAFPGHRRAAGVKSKVALHRLRRAQILRRSPIVRAPASGASPGALGTLHARAPCGAARSAAAARVAAPTAALEQRLRRRRIASRRTRSARPARGLRRACRATRVAAADAAAARATARAAGLAGRRGGRGGTGGPFGRPRIARAWFAGGFGRGSLG
jgi:hypothetical protein